MKTFKIEILETTTKVFDVEADDLDDAIEKLRGQYRNCELDMSDQEVCWEEYQEIPDDN